MRIVFCLFTFTLCFLLEAAKPNVVVILTDDQGWGDLSLNGNRDLDTPNIDSLARDGAKFDRFFVCAVCSPTRAEFLTGRYHVRGGVYSTSAGGERLDLLQHDRIAHVGLHPRCERRGRAADAPRMRADVQHMSADQRTVVGSVETTTLSG